ncbi:MAG: hypothetical protein NC184_03430 [Roseburia sp.]|nr:hypothetical protein [Roseburia sp.]
MKKTVKGKAYDTEKMDIVKKVTHCEYGNPAGYEEILFVAADGALFLYANGGPDSPYKTESLVALTKAKADAWKKANA